MRSPDLRAIDLGATLYVPATRGDLYEVVAGGKIPHLRSLVICLEDSIREDEIETGLANLGRLLTQLTIHLPAPGEQRPILLVRPRTPEMLHRLMRMHGVSHIIGFVLPKVTASNFPQWMTPVSSRPAYLLPTIETREAFDPNEMRHLREQLMTVQRRILCIRIGGNDLLQLFGARRSRDRTAYEGPLGAIISTLVANFAPYGFELSAPVLESFSNPDLLTAEIERDIEHGLLTKTAIHPNQIPVIHAAYAVDPNEYADAIKILSEDSSAVYASEGVMNEPATHRRWADNIIARARIYGTTSHKLQLVEVA